MKKADGKNIIPVLLGADLNAYSVALAFREAYGIKSHVFARYKCGATENSKFIITHIFAGLDDVGVAIPALLKFAAENNGSELFLIPCADWYVEMLEHAQAQLSGIYNIFLPDINIWRKVSDKCSFYSLMEKKAISYPRYISFLPNDKLSTEKLSMFEYPAVIKPSDSSEYWRFPFDEMRKVYFPKSKEESRKIIDNIFRSGYKKSVILQEKVGGINGNRVLTTVSDGNGKVVRVVLGEVILEEEGKTSLGNHSAIITIPLDKISFELIDFISEIGYTGIANFDIMISERKKYVLELNSRQGRSCDYLRAAGINIAELIVKLARGEGVAPDFTYKEIYWHYPPHKTVAKYADKNSVKTAERLYREGKSYTPYSNEYEGIVRRAYVCVHNVRLARKIKKDVREGRAE